MKNLFDKIMNNYLIEKTKKLKKNDFAEFFRKTSIEVIKNEVKINDKNYLLDASVGQGGWAEIPWIAILDKDITTTVQEGYDIVYLFRADMSGVYISLNQGWTYFKDKYGTKEGQEKIKKIANIWKLKLSSVLCDFNFEDIDLRSIRGNGSLAKGYELGHICGKFYSKEDLDNLILTDDLNKLIGVYRELKGKLRERSTNNIIEETNNYLLANSLLEKEIESTNNLEGIENTIEDYQESTILEEEIPKNFAKKENLEPSFKPHKTNYINKQKRNIKLGLAGELMVINFEKNYLEEIGRKDLASKIEHVSFTQGDGLGYDVLSYDKDGNKKYIEVKTTTDSETTEFYITDIELARSKVDSDKFYLYRIYEYNIKEKKGKFYILKGDLEKILELEPKNYRVNGIINKN